MASDSRFYQLELRHRPAMHGDIGSLLKIEGLVIGGEGAQAVLMLPGNVLWGENKWPEGADVFTLTQDEWTDWLQRSDNPEILVNGSLEKAFHRKVRYEISGAVQQKIWVRDGCKCMYCGATMGKAQLTIDHFVPLEMGGKNDTSNYLSACRKCNKDKGGMDPKDWCRSSRVPHSMTYDEYIQYLETRQIN
jgi:hypothetical protein